MKLEPFSNETIKNLEFWRKYYFEHLSVKNASKHTIRNYKRIIDEFIEWVFIENENCNNCISLKTFNRFVFTSFLSSLKEKKLSDKTIQTYLAVLKSFFMFITEENDEVIDIYQYLEKIQVKVAQKEIVTYSNDEINKIKKAVFDLLESKKISYSKYKNALIILFIIYTGMRAEEALNLQANDIEISEDIIKFKVKGKGNKERILYLSVDFTEYINKFIQLKKKHNIKSNYFFASQKGTKTIYNTILRFNRDVILQKAHIFDKRKVGLHTYRHTLATNLVNENVNLETIKEILGHTDIKTTSVFYAKTNEKAKKKALKQLFS